MTWLDWVVVAMLVYFIVQGLFKGVVAALLGTVAVVVSYVGAALALPVIGGAAAAGTPLPAEWSRLIGFVFVFLALYVVCMLLISVLPGARRPTMPAQVLGAAAGVVKALVAAMAGAGILLASPLSDAFAQDIERSPLVGYAAGMQRHYIQQLHSLSPIPFPPVGPDHKF